MKNGYKGGVRYSSAPLGGVRRSVVKHVRLYYLLESLLSLILFISTAQVRVLCLVYLLLQVTGRILSLTRGDEVEGQPRPRQKVMTIAGLGVT